MKRSILSGVFTVLSAAVIAQGQIGNSDFEQWEAVASDQEPVNWNSFLTATGGFAGFAANQIEQSSDVPAGSSGTSSARIWSRSTFGIIANGNMTLGQINMGSTTPSSSSNYNFSKTSDANFSEALTDTPDSLVFWVKFNPVNGGDMARVKSTLHDDYDYRDPEDATSANHVVAIAELNFPSTSGTWVRKSIPFDYSIGTVTGNTYILVTFTTNMDAGGGAANDEVFIDDVELIYNPASVDAVENNVKVGLDNTTSTLNFEGANGTYEVYSMSGVLVQSGEIKSSVSFDQPAGMYVVKTNSNNTVGTQKVIKQ